MSFSSFQMNVIRSVDGRSRSRHLPVHTGCIGWSALRAESRERGIERDLCFAIKSDHFDPGSRNLNRGRKRKSLLHLCRASQSSRGRGAVWNASVHGVTDCKCIRCARCRLLWGWEAQSGRHAGAVTKACGICHEKLPQQIEGVVHYVLGLFSRAIFQRDSCSHDGSGRGAWFWVGETKRVGSTKSSACRTRLALMMLVRWSRPKIWHILVVIEIRI